MKKKRGVRGREDTCGGSHGLIVRICICKNYLREEEKIGSLVSHLGILNDEFEELLAAGKVCTVWS